MRILIGIIMSIGLIASALAENPLRPITDLSEFSEEKRTITIDWNNKRPEQQRALNQFYRSIESAKTPEVSTERQHHVQELRSMTPQQRQQMFLNYVQQNR